MAVPLFNDAQLGAFPPTLPIGFINCVNPTHVVRLTLSTGDTVVFGTVEQMMRLIT